MMQKKTIIWILIISIILVLGSILIWVLFDYRGNQYPYYVGHMVGGWMMPMGMIGMGFVWFVVLMVLIQIFQSKEKEHQHAMDVLKNRLAKGEISIEEYEQLKKAIRGEQ